MTLKISSINKDPLRAFFDTIKQKTELFDNIEKILLKLSEKYRRTD